MMRTIKSTVAGVILAASVAVSGVTIRAAPVTCRDLVDSYIAECRLEEAGMTEVPEAIRQAAEKYGEQYAIAPEFLISMAWTESRFQQYAKGGDCCGVMQVNPEIHAGRMKRLGVSDIYDIDGNIHTAADYLAELFLEHEDPGIVLLAYNGAKTAMKEHRMTKYATGILEMSEAMERVNGK